jgi:hypothetical protein
MEKKRKGGVNPKVGMALAGLANLVGNAGFDAYRSYSVNKAADKARRKK